SPPFTSDVFWLRMRFGGGSAFSEARVRGRLYGRPLGNDGLQFSVIQTYNYQNNDAYSTGSPANDAASAVAADELLDSGMGWVDGARRRRLAAARRHRETGGGGTERRPGRLRRAAFLRLRPGVGFRHARPHHA